MRLLVIRNSAMGDVALVTPVLKELGEKYPDLEVMLLTPETYHPFFYGIKNLRLISPDFTNRHKGLKGIYQLYKDLTQLGTINKVLDLHDVLRSKVLRSIFQTKGIPVFTIDKGRTQKKALINGTHKDQLKHTIHRYGDVFAEAGFPLEPGQHPSILVTDLANKKAANILGTQKVLHIGIAPLAKHALKVWPEDKMIQLMHLLSAKLPCRFYLLGNTNESAALERFAKQVPQSTNLAGKYTLGEELAIIAKLNFVISMDSSNMHIAALLGTKVISIWGATDPWIGFGAWNQPQEYAIAIPMGELTCRPCTVYGKGKCKRLDFACMNQLSAQTVLDKIEKNNLLILQ